MDILLTSREKSVSGEGMTVYSTVATRAGFMSISHH